MYRDNAGLAYTLILSPPLLMVHPEGMASSRVWFSWMLPALLARRLNMSMLWALPSWFVDFCWVPWGKVVGCCCTVAWYPTWNLKSHYLTFSCPLSVWDQLCTMEKTVIAALETRPGSAFWATEICNPSAGRKQQTRFLSRCVPDMLVSQGYHSRCCLVVSNFNRYGWLASEERAAKKPSRADSAGLAKVGCLDFGRLWTSLGLKKRELNIFDILGG